MRTHAVRQTARSLLWLTVNIVGVLIGSVLLVAAIWLAVKLLDLLVKTLF